MSAFTHPKDIFPWRGLNTGANIQHFFDMTKHYSRNLKIFADLGVFLVQNVKCRA